MRTSLLTGLLLGLLACGDPLAFLEPPPVDRSIRLFMVLDPDSSRQALLLESLDPGGVYDDLRAELYADGTLVSEGEIQKEPGAPHLDSTEPCGQRYGTLGTDGAFACIVFEVFAEPGRTYDLVVSARDRPTARARTTVPGAFAITSIELDGEPPGSDRFDVRWNPSPHAYGYFVFLRSATVDCPDARGCPDGWLETTRDTTVSGAIPASLLDGGAGTLVVLALDRSLYQYLTTGTGGHFFSVPPVQNVEGGYGALGSWMRGSRP
jgi:hypothetical protein